MNEHVPKNDEKARDEKIHNETASDEKAGDEKAIEVAVGFIDLYGAVAELEVARRVLMFEAEGDERAVAAWRRVGEALRRLRGHVGGQPDGHWGAGSSK